MTALFIGYVIACICAAVSVVVSVRKMARLETVLRAQGEVICRLHENARHDRRLIRKLNGDYLTRRNARRAENGTGAQKSEAARGPA